ncbi:MAG: lipase family protein, partial [Eggerthellaceae bacterium]
NLHGDGNGSNDHHGFETVESEVESALDQYAREVGADPQRTRILITGHSRGGAIANLLAARLDDRSGTPAEIAPASGVYAYTFAAPGSTREADCQNAAYGNVFNIVNEADIVPQLPLSTWGYGRYGTTVSLPIVASGEFEESFDRMCQAFQRNTGVTPACDESSLASLDAFERNAAKALPSADALASPAGIAAAAQTLLGTDLAAALASHAPDAYIAWMQAVDGDALSFEGTRGKNDECRIGATRGARSNRSRPRSIRRFERSAFPSVAHELRLMCGSPLHATALRTGRFRMSGTSGRRGMFHVKHLFA